jgi:hypothetical protein
VAAPAAERRLWGLLAEFDTPGALVRAAARVRDAGYRRWDCHSPFPVHGLDRAMGLCDTRVPWLVLGAGIAGAAAAILMQWWMNARDYPLIVSGKPLFSLPAEIPIAFELTVLFAALAAFAGLFAFTGLPRFYHPTFRNAEFRRVTADRFFIAVEADDALFDVERTAALLRELGARRVDWLED